MARVRAGAKIIIENCERPVAILQAAEPVRRSIDPDFAKDVEEIVSHRKPWNPPAWE
jgi:antitoxin (DNA-binding transcriptional repressor) of toxin-antitoxin stability system